MPFSLSNRRLLLGVSGGIALYKVCDLVRKLKKEGAELRIVLTTGAEEFVKPSLFSALSQAPCYTNRDFFRSDGKILHIELARFPELIILVPATASLLSKLRTGQASELLLAILLASKAPVLIFPSMNTNMYRHPATQENLEKLKSYGYFIFSPEAGELACGEVGEGRLLEMEEILQIIKAFFKHKDFKGKKVLITAGPTREFLDEVRFLTNASSGKMGYALALEAYSRGAEVHLVWGLEEEPPFPPLIPLHGVAKPKVYQVRTTEEMFLITKELLPKIDVAIFSAAPCDFKPMQTFPGKLKKQPHLTIELRQTIDIAKTLREFKGDRIFVGFALEEEDKLEEYAQQKKWEKGFDLLVANPLSAMGSQVADFIIFFEDKKLKLPQTSKEDLAIKLFDLLALKLKGVPS